MILPTHVANDLKQQQTYYYVNVPRQSKFSVCET